MGLDDIDRPLNKRGKRDAPLMAIELSKTIATVDLVICSPARRARETCSYFIEAIPPGHKIIRESVYHAWVDTLIAEVTKIEDHVETAFIFGHNPGYTSVYNKFSSDRLDNLPTCGIFELICSKKWSDFSPSNVSTGLLMFPKMFING